MLLALVLAAEDSWPAFALWVVLAGSDGVDGYLARRHGTTRSGAFLDPLADKLLILGAMVALVVVGMFWWLPVALVAVREVGISLYRSVVGRRGVSVPARPVAKAKTLVQALAVGFALAPLTADDEVIYVSLLWFSVVLAFVSGAQYLLDGRESAADAV